ncbi:MAG: GNAT family N-acetyltransferase [Chloroflexi bacterium]|nr:GNAT family N-acetyltransferase [Chloroflexota bacterium]
MKLQKSRAYVGAKDLQSMIDLLIVVRPAERITDYPGIVDLREAMALISTQEKTRLWFNADDRLVGFAFVDPFNNLRFEFDRHAIHPDTPLEMINWGVVCIQHTMRESGKSLTLDTACRDDDIDRIALLEQHGFVMQEIRSLNMARSLNKPVPAPQLPAGFSIRHVAGEQEAAAIVALHRAAFGTKYMTVEKRLSTMRMSEYDAELDLLLITPNGRFSAYCTCSISHEDNERTGRNEGYLDIVATHPDFQRQGLARVLLLAGCRKLKRRGVETAVLGTNSKNIGMQRAAKKVGFHNQSTKVWFEKSVVH